MLARCLTVQELHAKRLFGLRRVLKWQAFVAKVPGLHVVSAQKHFFSPIAGVVLPWNQEFGSTIILPRRWEPSCSACVRPGGAFESCNQSLKESPEDVAAACCATCACAPLLRSNCLKSPARSSIGGGVIGGRLIALLLGCACPRALDCFKTTNRSPEAKCYMTEAEENVELFELHCLNIFCIFYYRRKTISNLCICEKTCLLDWEATQFGCEALCCFFAMCAQPLPKPRFWLQALQGP